VVGGVLLGVFLDALKSQFDARVAYCSRGLWSAVSDGLVLVAILGLYRSWQKYGGDKDYVPPLP
jgi:hypothetical protein